MKVLILCLGLVCGQMLRGTKNLIEEEQSLFDIEKEDQELYIPENADNTHTLEEDTTVDASLALMSDSQEPQQESEQNPEVIYVDDVHYGDDVNEAQQSAEYGQEYANYQQDNEQVEYNIETENENTQDQIIESNESFEASSQPINVEVEENVEVETDFEPIQEQSSELDIASWSTPVEQNAEIEVDRVNANFEVNSNQEQEQEYVPFVEENQQQPEYEAEFEPEVNEAYTAYEEPTYVESNDFNDVQQQMQSQNQEPQLEVFTNEMSSPIEVNDHYDSEEQQKTIPEAIQQQQMNVSNQINVKVDEPVRSLAPPEEKAHIYIYNPLAKKPFLGIRCPPAQITKDMNYLGAFDATDIVLPKWLDISNQVNDQDLEFLQYVRG